MALRAPPMPPVNETEYSVSRITREGKKLTYKLSVMQQPERARACGAGAKSSADRRPVDPPPVVELHVLESDPADDLQQTDITFAYNANFFLYATLETARPIAHGKAAAPITCPVLTGVPVAGVAYLDRPAQAGYFIFPDLSVRHEGRYRLSFHLYEEIKDPKDMDKDAPPATQSAMLRPAAPGKPGVPQAHLHFRLEVKSAPFTVYSAKKFPGLATSTSLSRVIAEQGCRVRIRRDVRMRRRGEKQDDEYEYEEEQRVFARTPRYTTPDGYVAPSVDRPRSTSITTGIIEPSLAYAAEAQRRPSAASEYGVPPAQPQPLQRPPAPASPAPPAPAPPTSTNPASYHSHLAFGGPPVPYQTPLLPSGTHANAPPVPYSPQTSSAHVRHSSNSSEYETGSNGYQYGPSRSQTDLSEYSNTALPPLRLEPLPPKSSSAGQPFAEHRPSDASAYSVPRSQTPATNTAPSLPPLKVVSGGYTPNGHPHTTLSAPGIPHSSAAAAPPPPPSLAAAAAAAPQSAQKFLYETGAAVAKRSHEDSFGHDERPMQNGMRPDSEAHPPPLRKQLEPSRYFYLEPRPEMEYKRANGRMVMKVPPTLQ